MKKNIFSFFILSFFCCTKSYTQEIPILKQQISLDKVSEVFSGSSQNVYLFKSEDIFTLIDQTSKIQLGTLQLDLGDFDIPGKGKTFFLRDSGILISTGQELLTADIISGKVDTLFNQVKFPEFIINYLPLPWNKDIILINTKTYPVSKNGDVYFSSSDEKKQTVYDDSKNCRLILFDIKHKAVVASVSTSHSITAFAEYGYENKILAGTFHGDVLKIDERLVPEIIFHPFNFPIHSLLQQQGLVFVIPHIGPKYIGAIAQGRICIYNLTSKAKREVLFPSEIPVVKSKYGMNPQPSNGISQLFSFPQDSSVLVNYGFTKLVRISLPDLDTSYFPVLFNSVKFHCFNKDSTQLVASVAEYPGILKMYGELNMYDLTRKKVQASFRKTANQLEYKYLVKLYDKGGNYHIIGQKESGFFSIDTLVVYSSNKTSPTFLIGGNCHFIINDKDGTLTLSSSGKNFVYGLIHLENLGKNSYSFHIKDMFDNVDTLHKSIFTVLFDSRKLTQDDRLLLPYEVSGISRLDKGSILEIGHTTLNNKTFDRYVIIDSTGKLIFNSPDYETSLINDLCKISATNNYIAVNFRQKGLDVLEIWDIRFNKRLFSKIFEQKKFLQFYCFDKSQDVLWYSQNIIDNTIKVFNVKLDEAEVIEAFVFADPNFLSFETDINNDQVASESYNRFDLFRLSDHKLLYHVDPLSSFFTISHQPTGFGFSSKTEYHLINSNLSYLYFTSFEEFKPVEILNNYLYRGEKSAIDNLAFIRNRKGFMPSDYDLFFNRPDSVLLQSGSLNVSYNQLIGKAVEKRKRINAKKIFDDGIDNRPIFSILNKKDVPEIVDLSELKLSINAKSISGKPISYLHILDNGIPIFGKLGLPVALPSLQVQQLITIPLVRGLNSLQLSVSDSDGISSSVEIVSTFLNLKESISKRFFVGIGIDEFADNKYNLKYSAKDIRDLSFKLKEKFGNEISIDTLFNHSVTIENIKALKEKLKKSTVNDKVMVAYSGHGLLSKQLDYYLSTYAVDFENPGQNGLPYEELENLLDSIPARKKLLLIDACHSGEVDKEEGIAMNNSVDSLGLSKGVIIKNSQKPQVGLKNSFELMQSLFVNVGKSTGATIISAAAGNQFALERGDLKNGVFTYAILEAMNAHHTLKVSELKKIVGERVEQLTNGMQKPTSRNETIAVDWEVWGPLLPLRPL